MRGINHSDFLGRTINSRNERASILFNKLFYLRQSHNKVSGKFSKRYGSDQNQQADPSLHNCCFFIGFIAYSLIVRDCVPATTPNLSQPFLIFGNICKVIRMFFDGKARLQQKIGELLAQISIREKDNAQAARSYTIAISISSGLRS